jgi:hypothetical protein
MMMCTMCMATLCGGGGALGDGGLLGSCGLELRKKSPPARLLAPVSDK